MLAGRDDTCRTLVACPVGSLGLFEQLTANAATRTAAFVMMMCCMRIMCVEMPNVQHEPPEPAADDVRFVSERTGWLRFAAPSGWPIQIRLVQANAPSNAQSSVRVPGAPFARIVM